MRYFILVTGASTGIGEHACGILIRHGYNVIAGIRTGEDARRLKASHGAPIHPILMEVTDKACMEKAVAETMGIIGDGSLVAIINNAGIAISGAVLYIPVEEWRKQFEVNVLGMIRTIQLFFPLLCGSKQEGDTHPRRIINMSSVSGLFASPFIGPYVASKYAVEAMSDSLRRELYMHDIQVVIIEPGNIMTPIWEKARQTPPYFGPEYDSILRFKDEFIENNYTHGIPLTSMDDVILRAVREKKVKLRYLIRPQKWKFRLIRLLPARWVDAMIRKKLQQKSGVRPF